MLPSVDFADADQSHFNSAGLLAPRHRGPVVRDHRLARPHARRRRRRPTTRSRGSASRTRPTRCSSRTAPRRRRSTTRATSTSTSRASGTATASPAAYRDAVAGRDAPRGPRRRAAHLRQRLPGARPARSRCGWTTSTRCRRCRSPTPTPTSARRCATWPACSAPASARASPRSRSGGFDTHDDQPDDHAELLTDLGDSLLPGRPTSRPAASRAGCSPWSGASSAAGPRTTTSSGTDHGAGGLVMVVGDRANGGIRSEFPGLAQLDEDDNLLVTTEFRTVYATLLESWIGRGGGARAAQDRRRAAAPGDVAGRAPARRGRMLWSATAGRLAQLGEHQLDKLGVTGSSPVTPITDPHHRAPCDHASRGARSFRAGLPSLRSCVRMGRAGGSHDDRPAPRHRAPRRRHAPGRRPGAPTHRHRRRRWSVRGCPRRSSRPPARSLRTGAPAPHPWPACEPRGGPSPAHPRAQARPGR